MSMQVVIFDMDGVIIDFEVLWCQVQIDVFVQWGVMVSVVECEILIKGKCFDDIVGIWCCYFQFDFVLQWFEDVILQCIICLIVVKGEMMCGVQEVLCYFCEVGYKIVFVMLLFCQVIVVVLNKFLFWYFFDVIFSVDDELCGKLYLVVYFMMLWKFNFNVSQCLVIEDSFIGFCVVQLVGIVMIVIVEDIQYVCFQVVVGCY